LPVARWGVIIKLSLDVIRGGNLMIRQRILSAALLVGIVGTLLAAFCCEASLHAQDKKKEKDPLEGKKGTTIGTLVAKEKNYIEVKADGEEKGRKYVPQWVGRNPGGPDPDMLKVFAGLKVGSRLEVEWLFEERFRAMKVKVLKLPIEKDKDQ
jgi:hypothetical protein